MHHDAPSANLAAILCLLVTACTVPDPDAAAERAAVNAALDSVYATFSEAYARADITLLMDEVYAEDAYYLPPDSPILQGQDQFRGQFSFLERFARDGGPGPRISFDIVDRDIDGDLAYDIGVYSIVAPGAAGDAEPGRGKFIVIWKRIDGDWRIRADGFSPLE
ncbi:MAG: YybH family protein [Candidatus Longimicrobiales bacterium M2_2A_002]